MNIHRHVLFLLAVFIIPFQAVSAFAGDACEKVDIDFMHRHLTIPPHTSIASKAPVNGLCQVILNIDGTYFTTYASDGGYVILGKMYSDQAI
ncbi:MAG: hypothetical protein JW724_03315, partial [Candidatus Altiarchaeota archaeon]|nr:hypothetical protein [Candidatus Altiarchaeota archaeon]